jgi:hypothetical protein
MSDAKQPADISECRTELIETRLKAKINELETLNKELIIERNRWHSEAADRQTRINSLEILGGNLQCENDRNIKIRDEWCAEYTKCRDELQAAEAKIVQMQKCFIVEAETAATRADMIVQLQARIDAAEKQEPVCYFRTLDGKLDWDEDCVSVGTACADTYMDDCPERYAALPLYTHPAIPPEGMMLVPVEPTEEMIKAAFDTTRSEWSDPVRHFVSHYKAMLKAVPAKGE